MKGPTGCPDGAACAGFPSPKGGGSIEGWSRKPYSAGYSEFPSPKGGGSIEGPSIRAGRLSGWRPFPSPKGGGSIEGRPSAGDSPRSRSFHRRRAVAPLKAHGAAVYADLVRRFHRRRAVAPLKGLARTNDEGDMALFPSPKGGGSIEGSTESRSARRAGAGFHRRRAVAPLKA